MRWAGAGSGKCGTVGSGTGTSRTSGTSGTRRGNSKREKEARWEVGVTVAVEWCGKVGRDS